MSYFIFNGVDSRTYGILERCPVPPTSEQKTTSLIVPARNEDITKCLDMFNNIIIPVTLGITDKSKLRNIYSWLYGTGELILSQNLNEKYIVKRIKVTSQYLSERFAKISVNFTCSPFAYAVTPSVVNINTDYTAVENPGTYYSEPVITFDVIADEAPVLQGDVNFDGKVDAIDASMVVTEYSNVQTGGEPTFTDAQNEAADVNNDGAVDAIDASLIMDVYAQTQTGGSTSPVEPPEKQVQLTVNDETLTIGLPAAVVRNGFSVTVDSANRVLYYTNADGKKVNILHLSSGRFPLLLHTGTNYAKYSGDVTNVNITVNERWL